MHHVIAHMASSPPLPGGALGDASSRVFPLSPLCTPFQSNSVPLPLLLVSFAPDAVSVLLTTEIGAQLMFGEFCRLHLQGTKYSIFLGAYTTIRPHHYIQGGVCSFTRFTVIFCLRDIRADCLCPHVTQSPSSKRFLWFLHVSQRAGLGIDL